MTMAKSFERRWLSRALAETLELARVDSPGRAVFTLALPLASCAAVAWLLPLETTIWQKTLLTLGGWAALAILVFVWKVFSTPGRLAREQDAALHAAEQKVAELVEQPHPHDLALMAAFNELINAPTRRFLRDHNVAVSFKPQVLDPFGELGADWVDAGHEFQDAELQRLLELVKLHADDFLQDILGYTNAIGVGQFVSIISDHERATDFFSQETSTYVRRLNDKANALGQAINDLEGAAIRRLRIAAR